MAFATVCESKFRRDLRIFCMSATFEHPLLWSHYASSHTGVCLHIWVEHRSVFGLARGADYSKPRPPVLIPIPYNASERAVGRAMSLIKADFWCYESEYRILGHATADWGMHLKCINHLASAKPRIRKVWLAPDRVVDSEPRPGSFEGGAGGQDVHVSMGRADDLHSNR
jgi:hypothetical protein